MHAVVQVPAFGEGSIRPTDYERTLRAIVDQPAPSGWTVEFEAWITPDTSSVEDDPTWTIAQSIPGLDVFEAPSGKLSTRNAAHEDALARGVDAIVVWDSDVRPRSPDVLSALLEPLEQPDVLAVNSVERHPPTVAGFAMDFIFKPIVRGPRYMHGQCHSMTAGAWEQFGPFDESIDQTDIREMWTEEQNRMYDVLDELGTIAQPADAVVVHQNRRMWCKMGKAWRTIDGRQLEPWCQNRGEKSFDPTGRTRAHEPTGRRRSQGGSCCGGSPRNDARGRGRHADHPRRNRRG